MVRSKDPSSAQVHRQSQVKRHRLKFEPEIATKEVGVQTDLPPDIIMADNTENVLSEGLRFPVISKSPPSLVQANNSNIYQSRPRGAGVHGNGDHPPNSKTVADLEGIKLDFKFCQNKLKLLQDHYPKIHKIKKKP